jgi:hypothetical protein
MLWLWNQLKFRNSLFGGPFLLELRSPYQSFAVRFNLLSGPAVSEVPGLQVLFFPAFSANPSRALQSKLSPRLLEDSEKRRISIRLRFYHFLILSFLASFTR